MMYSVLITRYSDSIHQQFMVMGFNRSKLNYKPNRLGNMTALVSKQLNRKVNMNTTVKLVAITLAISAAPAMASSNSPVWTSSNGFVVVDGNGKPVRTIHYQNNTQAAFTQTPKASVSLVTAIKQAVATVFNPKPKLVLMPEPLPAAVLPVAATLATQESIKLPPTDAPPTDVTALVIAPEIVPVIAAPKEITTPVAKATVIAPQPEYSFHHYQTTVLFDTDSTALSANASGSLKQLVMATGLADKVISVEVIGHADTRGDQAYNMTLSEQRMYRVANFLEGLQVRVSAMFAKGETSPVVGDKGEDLAKSRRVQVAIKTRHLKD
jgi:outer membrane protein OmpA-like peptidoglycan-associated protein